MSTITKVVNVIVSVCLVLVGFMHFCLVIDDRNSWCKDLGCSDSNSNCDCMGEFVVWSKEGFMDENVDSPIAPLTAASISNIQKAGNSYDSAGWGSVFTVEPVEFLVIWGPFILAMLGLCEHLHPFSLGIIHTPKRLFCWYFFMMFFVAFPCAGNWGIVTAMMCILPMICCLLMICLCPKHAVSFRGAYCGCYSYCMDDAEHETEGSIAGTQKVHEVKKPKHHHHEQPDMELLQMGDSKSKKSKPVTIQVPQGYKPGDSITVELDGVRHAATVPAGVHAGDSFQFDPNGHHEPPRSPRKEPKSPRKEPKEPKSPRKSNDPARVAPPSPRKSSPPVGPVAVTVPDGAAPGDELTIEIGGKQYNIQVPRGVKSGQTFEFDPSNPSSGDNNTQDRETEVEIEVPAGAQGGDELTIELGGDRTNVRVPDGLKPGDKFVVQAPVKAPKKKKSKKDKKDKKEKSDNYIPTTDI